MNAPTFAAIALCLLLNPVSKASLLPFLKRGLNELNHFLNIPHPFVSVLFPEPVEAKNITIKLGFIGALDNSLGATASLGEELVSNLLLPITWGLLVTQQFAAFLKLTLIALYFQSSAFKVAIEVINEEAVKPKVGSQIRLSMDFKSKNSLYTVCGKLA